MSNVEEFIEHFGVKGMRWGVRNKSRTHGENLVDQINANAVKMNPSIKKKLKIANKEYNKRSSKLGPSKDSKRTMATFRKARKNSTRSLTNQEIKDVLSRIEMEKRFNSIAPSRSKRGKNIVKEILAVGGTINAAIALAKSPAGQAIAKKISKK